MADKKGSHSKRKNSSSSTAQLYSNRKIRETPYQDINRIRRNILAVRETKGRLDPEDLFVDPSFASDMTSLAYVYSGDDKYERAVFKRPQEKMSDCVLVGLGGACDEPFPWRHWKQRHWFQAALVVVSLSVRHLEKLIPGYKNLEQGFGADYTGAFHFNIWRFGEWVDVVVDDRLPMVDDHHLFCGPMGSARELWGPLVEKAYAKCKKTYQSIEYGRTLDALTDLTGSVCEYFTPDVRAPRNLFRILVKSHLARSLMVCWRNDKRLTSTGFSADTDYQELQNQRFLHVITAVTKFPTQDGRLVEMLRMKCPFKSEPRWQGHFSDRDFAAWESVNRDFLQRFQPLTKKDEDEYWISMDDFRCNFGGLFIVSSVEPFRVDGLNLTRSYHMPSSAEHLDTYPAFLASDVGLGYNLHRRGSTPRPHNTGGKLLDADTLQLAHRRASHASIGPFATSLFHHRQHRNNKRHSLQARPEEGAQEVNGKQKSAWTDGASDVRTVQAQRPDQFPKGHVLDTAMTSETADSPSSPTESSCGAAILDQGFKKGFFFRSSSHQQQKKSRRKSTDLQRLAHAQSEAQRAKKAAAKTKSDPSVLEGKGQDEESKEMKVSKSADADAFLGESPDFGRLADDSLEASTSKASPTSSSKHGVKFNKEEKLGVSVSSKIPKSPRRISATAAVAGEQSLAIASAHMLPKSPMHSAVVRSPTHGRNASMPKAPSPVSPRSERHAGCTAPATGPPAAESKGRGASPSASPVKPKSPRHPGRTLVTGGADGRGPVTGDRPTPVSSSRTSPKSPKQTSHTDRPGAGKSTTPRTSPTPARSPYRAALGNNHLKHSDSRGQHKASRSPFSSPRRQPPDTRPAKDAGPTTTWLSPGQPPKSPSAPPRSPRRSHENGPESSQKSEQASLSVDRSTRPPRSPAHIGHIQPAWVSVDGESGRESPPASPSFASKDSPAASSVHNLSPTSSSSTIQNRSDGQHSSTETSPSNTERSRKVFTFPHSAKPGQREVKGITPGAAAKEPANAGSFAAAPGAGPLAESEASDSFDEDFAPFHKPARQAVSASVIPEKKISSLASSQAAARRTVRSVSSASDTDSTHSASDIFLHFKSALTHTASLGHEPRSSVSRERGYDSEREEEAVGCFKMPGAAEDKRPHSAPQASLPRPVSSNSLSSLTQGHFRATKADYFRSDGRWSLLIDVHDKWTRLKPCSGRGNLDLHSRSQRHHFHISRPEYPDEVSPPTLQSKRHVLVSLMQDYRHGAPTANSLLVPIGFCLYKSKGTETRDDRRHISKFPLLEQVQGEPEVREVNARFDLDPGNYFLVPYFLSESHEGEYLLRVLTEESSHAKAGCRAS